MHESKCHDESSFITLTYDDAHLPVDGSLSVEACQSFMKRLRDRVLPTRIRFFLCGEYGEERQRPHYHAIIFGYGFPDRKRLKGDGSTALYTSELLSEVWGQGHASVGSVSFDSASYVANYATKKVVGKGADDFYRGRRPEFLLMSRRPGIGNAWIKRFFLDVYPRDEVIVRGVKARPPRYYDQVFSVDQPDAFEAVRLAREFAADKLEEWVHPRGWKFEVAPSRNVYRLRVREAVTRAKLALKKRSLGD